VLPEADFKLLADVERAGVLKIHLRREGEEVKRGQALYEAAMRLAGFGLLDCRSRPYARDVNGDAWAEFELTADGRVALRLERNYQADHSVSTRRTPRSNPLPGAAATVAVVALLAVGSTLAWRTWTPAAAQAEVALQDRAPAAVSDRAEAVTEAVLR
jgi:hypothetical protein